MSLFTMIYLGCAALMFLKLWHWGWKDTMGESALALLVLMVAICGGLGWPAVAAGWIREQWIYYREAARGFQILWRMFDGDGTRGCDLRGPNPDGDQMYCARHRYYFTPEPTVTSTSCPLVNFRKYRRSLA